MKSILKRLVIGIMASVLFISSCKNPAEDVEIVVNTNIFKSPTLILFLNEKTKALNPSSFPIEITGPNADLVCTTTGGKVFKVAGGMLNIMLDRNANPSVANPVKFTVVVNAPGFAPTFKEVTITSTTTPNVLRVPLIEYANPPQGVGSNVDTKNIAAGVATSELKFTTATHANMTQQAGITVQPGTSFLDASGQSVGGAQLEARIVYQGKAPDGSVASLPGGNTSSNIILANGQAATKRYYFHSLGAVTIDMFAGGKEVKSFSKPLIVDLELGNPAVDPKTRLPLIEGQTVPMWSLNEETGQWKSEGNAIVVKNANGNLIGRMQITHLSSWSMFFPEDENEARFCKTNITVTRPKSDHAVSLAIRDNGGDVLGSVNMAVGESSKTVDITTTRYSYTSLSVGELFYSLDSQFEYEELTASVTPGDCGSSITFNYKPNTDVKLNVDLSVYVKCRGKNLQTGLNAIILMNRIGGSGSSLRIYSLDEGFTSATLVEGASYKIIASVDGQEYTSEFTVKKENFQLPVYPGISGSSSYNAASNTLKVNALVTKDCN